MDIQQPGKGEMVEDQEKWEKTQEVTSCQRTGSQFFMCVKITWDAYLNANSQATFLNQFSWTAYQLVFYVREK